VNLPAGAGTRSKGFGGENPDMRGPRRGRVADRWGHEIAGHTGSGEREGSGSWAGMRNSAQEGEIPFSFSTGFSKYTGVKINLGKYLGTSEKCEIFHGGRFEYLAQLLYWEL
jgi:hypothetical protein